MYNVNSILRFEQLLTPSRVSLPLPPSAGSGPENPKDELIPGQGGLQLFLLLVSLFAVPWMLLPKPLILKKRHEAMMTAKVGLSRCFVRRPPRTMHSRLALTLVAFHALCATFLEATRCTSTAVSLVTCSGNDPYSLLLPAAQGHSAVEMSQNYGALADDEESRHRPHGGGHGSSGDGHGHGGGHGDRGHGDHFEFGEIMVHQVCLVC